MKIKLPKITGSPTARKEAYEARMRDKDYNFAVQTGLSVRGNWRKRAARERSYAENSN
jgi:hypothetical protein